MSQAWAVVLASVVTTSGAILVAIMNRFRKENREDHMTVMSMLRLLNRSVNNVGDKVDFLDERLDAHMREDHKPKK